MDHITSIIKNAISHSKVLILITIFLTLDLPLAFSQTNTKWDYFSKYSEPQKKLIKDNWSQYFKADFLQSLKPELNTFSIKLDSYGSLYPEREILNCITDEGFANPKRKDVNLLKYSFYEAFLENYDEINRSVPNLKDVNAKLTYLKIMNLLKTKPDFSEESMEGFYDLWDEHLLDLYCDSLKKVIAANKFDRVLFFIHGYNVPYSLATIQTIELSNIIEKLQIDKKIPQQKILYVPVFWPSNDQKKCEIGSKPTFNIDNIKGLFDGGATNGIRFLYYANRSYYAAITLRKILNALNDQSEVKISIYSHSLGAIVATSALINTYSKLHSDYVDLMKSYDPSKDEDKLHKMKKAELLTYDIFKGLNGTTIPNKKMNVFLSAAAMPGINTFTDMVIATNNANFYCTINKKDEMLTKSAITIMGKKIPKLNASDLNATTLGCDFDEDISNTFEYFKTHISQNRFHSKDLTLDTDHDILTYFQNLKYVSFIAEFLND
jgi:hypothetical protein